jgi:hypothetical protein
MERSSATQLSPDQEHSAGELVKMMSEQVSTLIRDELKLAQLEMTSKGKQAALGAGMFGASGVVAVYGVGCLLACAIIAISGVLACRSHRRGGPAGRRRGRGACRQAAPEQGHASRPERSRRQRQGRC